MKTNNRLTGPTPIPASVLEAMNKPMISHRSDLFKSLFEEIQDGLKKVFGAETSNVLPFSASGTGGMEAAVVNGIAQGDDVLSVNIGYFGTRFADISRTFGANVTSYNIEWGKAADPDELRKIIRENSKIKAVLITHNETSTGVLNPLKMLADVVHQESDALIIVDVISSLGGTAIDMDKLGLDIVVGTSQKAMMAPPGMALVGVSEKAMKLISHNNNPRYYFDFKKMSTSLSGNMTSYTPAISVLYGLHESLRLILDESLDNVFKRHYHIALESARMVKLCGFEPFADSQCASPTVTSILLNRHSAIDTKKRLEESLFTSVSLGRGVWEDKMIRIGHMGNVTIQEVEKLFESLLTVTKENNNVYNH